MPSWCDLQIDPDGDVTEIAQTPGQSTTNVMSQKAASDSFANALAGSASGEIVSLDDVSPIAHEMAASVRKKNLCKENGVKLFYFAKEKFVNDEEIITSKEELLKLINKSI